ncbi:unnamed protein product [Protopolystoma xenopodis]|uniref:C3H1-type domain-containing protein n=1 Tax=Protopolystoma xenopodis TaxID=117903 RepID=A0A448WP67_9PLAT|nr:unnamed protein product [Protopolystoma xenopodis]
MQQLYPVYLFSLSTSQLDINANSLPDSTQPNAANASPVNVSIGPSTSTSIILQSSFGSDTTPDTSCDSCASISNDDIELQQAPTGRTIEQPNLSSRENATLVPHFLTLETPRTSQLRGYFRPTLPTNTGRLEATMGTQTSTRSVCVPRRLVGSSRQPISPRLKTSFYLKNILYKTVPCRDFTTNGICPRGLLCKFAHGLDDLHDPMQHPLYKTSACFDYQLTGHCPRGAGCFHVHDPAETRPKPDFTVTLAAASSAGNSVGRSKCASLVGELEPRPIKPDEARGMTGPRGIALKTALPPCLSLAEPGSVAGTPITMGTRARQQLVQRRQSVGSATLWTVQTPSMPSRWAQLDAMPTDPDQTPACQRRPPGLEPSPLAPGSGASRDGLVLLAGRPGQPGDQPRVCVQLTPDELYQVMANREAVASQASSRAAQGGMATSHVGSVDGTETLYDRFLATAGHASVSSQLTKNLMNANTF